MARTRTGAAGASAGFPLLLLRYLAAEVTLVCVWALKAVQTGTAGPLSRPGHGGEARG